jgi:hypothetical protein
MASEFGTPIHQLPLIPANVLKKHRVDEPLDPRFRSAARLLQALWREDRGLPIGSYVSEDGKRRKLGSRISEAAGRAGGNFLTPEIAHTARREAAYREIGALFDAERLATNLLSCMPLTFNLLAPWGHTPQRASGYLRELLPAFTGSAQEGLQQPISKVMPCRPPIGTVFLTVDARGAPRPNNHATYGFSRGYRFISEAAKR